MKKGLRQKQEKTKPPKSGDIRGILFFHMKEYAEGDFMQDYMKKNAQRGGQQNNAPVQAKEK